MIQTRTKIGGSFRRSSINSTIRWNYYPVLDGAEGPFDIFKEVQYDESQFTYALEGEHLVSLAGGTDGDPRIVAVDFSGYRSVDELVDVGIQVSGIIAVAVRFPTSCNC